MPGGFSGVDVFFVISGYLITRLILAEYESGVFTLSKFWLRRVRRILPALITMVVATCCAGYTLFYYLDLNELGQQGIAVLFSMANVFFWIRTGNYWGPQAENSVFLHAWTLSVEEQFYLFFPLLLLFFLKYGRRHLVPIVAALVVLSFSLFVWGSRHHPTATFYLLPTRAWELGCGCLLAAAAYEKRLTVPSSWALFLSSAGLVAIMTSFLFMSGENAMAGGLVIPVLGTVCVLAFSEAHRGLVGKILVAAPLVYIGKISYSLYLWHWPLIVLSKELSLGNTWSTTALLLIVTFALSMVSYHVVETPARRNKNAVRYITACFAATVALVISLSIYTPNLSKYGDVTWKGRLYNVAPNQDWPTSVENRMKGITVLTPEVSNENAYAKGGLIKYYGGEIPQAVVLGDSHALVWAGVLDEIFQELETSVSFYATEGDATFMKIPVTRTGATPFFTIDEKYTFDTKRLEFLSEWKPHVVFLIVRWSTNNNITESEDLIHFLGELGTKVFLIEQPPEIFASDKNAPQYLAYKGVISTEDGRGYFPKRADQRYADGLNMVRQIAEQHPHCELIPIADLFVKENNVWVVDGSDVLYIDDDHLSHEGALRAKSRIKTALQNGLPLEP
jgi:peptidoglycan/LPS O-acetylase OafA/YrhL